MIFSFWLKISWLLFPQSFHIYKTKTLLIFSIKAYQGCPWKTKLLRNNWTTYKLLTVRYKWKSDKGIVNEIISWDFIWPNPLADKHAVLLLFTFDSVDDHCLGCQSGIVTRQSTATTKTFFHTTWTITLMSSIFTVWQTHNAC